MDAAEAMISLQLGIFNYEEVMGVGVGVATATWAKAVRKVVSAHFPPPP